MELVYFLSYVTLGLLLDWALYWRIVNTFGMPGFYGSDDGYVGLLFPRILLTLAGTVIVFLARSHEDMRVALVLVGGGIFLLSTFYAAYRYLSGR